VLAAGGIGSARALAAVLAAGAAGARCGTRFIAARESAAHPVYVQALIAAGAEDSIRTERYHVGCPLCPSTHGVLRSATQAAESLEEDVVVGELRMRDQTFAIARFQGVPPPIKPVTGQIEAMCCYAGQSVGDVHAIQPAAEIVAELLGARAAEAASAAATRAPTGS
jgi:nitronate monooxygenase